MDVFKGKYERTSAENYEEFLKALDVSYLLRKAATVSTPVLEITENSGLWSIKSSTTLKSIELKFKVLLYILPHSAISWNSTQLKVSVCKL